VLIVTVGELCVSLDPASRGRAYWSSLLKVSCCIDTNVEHSFVTGLHMWILATVQPSDCAPALTFVLCLNPSKYHWLGNCVQCFCWIGPVTVVWTGGQ